MTYNEHQQNEESVSEQNDNNQLYLSLVNNEANISIVDDINMVNDMVNDGRMVFCNHLQLEIDMLFTIMSALTIAISCSQNRGHLLQGLEYHIPKCESYYSDHIPLFSNIIRTAKELLNSERQSGWVDR
jgi:hypothetical protein